MEKENKNINQLTSSRSVGMRDINAALFAPISRIKTLRDDEGRNTNVGQAFPGNKGMTSNLNTPLTPVLTHSTLSHKGEGENKYTPSPWRGRACPVMSEYGVAEGRMRGKSAFTLVELLVVVIIIAILATIAVPQYQKAVFNSRITKAISFMRNLEQAENDYLLVHSTYTSDWKNLIFDHRKYCWSSNNMCQIKVLKELIFELEIGEGTKTARYYRIYCITSPTHKLASDFCKKYGRYSHSNKYGDYYRMKYMSAKTGPYYYNSTNHFL